MEQMGYPETCMGSDAIRAEHDDTKCKPVCYATTATMHHIHVPCLQAPTPVCKASLCRRCALPEGKPDPSFSRKLTLTLGYNPNQGGRCVLSKGQKRFLLRQIRNGMMLLVLIRVDIWHDAT